MRTQQQSGSIIIFVIVGVLLAAAVVGGIVLVQKRGNETANTEVASPFGAQQQEGRVDDKEPSAEEQNSQEDKEAKQKAEAEKKAAEGKKAQEERAAQEAKEKELAERAAAAEQSRQKPAANEDASVSPGPIARTGGGVQPDDLPTTGPVEDALAATFGLMAIFGAGYVYYHYGRK